MLIRIQVKPNSKTDSISIDNGGVLKVKIRAEPVEGKANKYLLKYLSALFRVSKSKIEIIKGHTSVMLIVNCQYRIAGIKVYWGQFTFKASLCN